MKTTINKKKVAILTTVGVLALAGLSTGLALGIDAANKHNEAAIDSDYIDLSFDNRAGTFGNITNLTSDNPVTKTITVNIDKAGVIGENYYINYTFTATSDVVCSIYDKELKNDGNDVAIYTLNKTTKQCSVKIDTTAETYTNYVKFTISPDFNGDLDGTLDVEFSTTSLNA